MRDIVLAARRIAYAPFHSLLVVGALGVGFACFASVCTVVVEVMMKPLPYPDTGQLVRLASQVPGTGIGSEWRLSAAQFLHLRNKSQTLRHIGAYQSFRDYLDAGGSAEQVKVTVATKQVPALMGLGTVHGRLFDESDEHMGAPLVAVLSRSLWRRSFGSSAAVVGSVIRLHDFPIEVVGVVDRDVRLPEEEKAGATNITDIWVPLQINEAGPFFNQHDISSLAQVRTDVNLTQVRNELGKLTSELPDIYPQVYNDEFMETYGFRTEAVELSEYVIGDLRFFLSAALGSAALVLCAAFFNVAGILLYRVERARLSFTTWIALGGSKRQFSNHFILEVGALTMVASVVGLAITSQFVDWFVTSRPFEFPRSTGIGIGPTILATVGLVAALATIVLVIGALTRLNWTGAMIERGNLSRPHRRSGTFLIAVQATVAYVLAFVAGMLIESASNAGSANTGLDPSGVVAMEIYPQPNQFDNVQLWRFLREAEESVKRATGATQAGAITILPFQGAYWCVAQAFEETDTSESLDEARLTSCAAQASVTPGYFQTVGLERTLGRLFEASDLDNRTPGAVVVSEEFVRRFWLGDDPIGKGVAPYGRSEGPFYRVIGVVSDTFNTSTRDSPAPLIYYPMVPIPDHKDWQMAHVEFITKQPGEANPQAIAAIVEGINESVAVSNVRSLRQIVNASTGTLRFALSMTSAAALIALVLVFVGSYGLVSEATAGSIREIGLRLALGERAWRTCFVLVRRAVVAVVIGCVAGVALAAVLAPWVAPALYDVRPFNLATFLSCMMILTAGALAASSIPAYRATRLMPWRALTTD